MQRLVALKESFSSLDASQQQQLLIGSGVAVGGIVAYLLLQRKTAKVLPLGQGWWGEGQKPVSEDDKIYPFKVETSDKEIEDLHERLDKTRYADSLEDSNFNYGFNLTYLRRVASYWRNDFDWKKQVDVLNRYPHFKTKIEGLDVHFIRVSPPPRKDQKVIPLMMVHGWPGSFFEFYKILPILTQNHNGIAFEVICPSIPGYGYSEAPHKKGFDSLAAARIFLTLMERLGFNKFYLQGGDWGSLITTNMAQMKPDCVKGLHLNMLGIASGLKQLWSIMIGRYLPFLVGLTQEDVRRLYPFFQKNVVQILKETGYMHIQATKPDTAGSGVNDSPVGLAAYILEKFSSWADMANRDLADGGLDRKFSLDDLLTNVMIYWTTGSITSSMRFYKENFRSNIYKREDMLASITVPTGVAAFPHELQHCPKSWAQSRYRNISTYNYMPRGGHFAAFEEPQLLADDFVKFVQKVEKL